MASAEVLPIVLTADDRSKDAFRSLVRNVTDAKSAVDILRSSVSGFDGSIGSAGASMGNLARAGQALKNPWVAGAAAIAAAAGSAVLAHMELSGLGDAADDLGMKASEIDKLEVAFRKTGGAVFQLVPAMKHLRDEAETELRNGGFLEDLFKLNGKSMTDSVGLLRPVKDIYRDVGGMIRDAGNETDRLKIATEAFGSEAGPKMVRMIVAGGDAIENLKKGRDALDPLVDRAQDFDRLWKSMAGGTDNWVDVLKSRAMPAINYLYFQARDIAAWSGSKSALQSQFIDRPAEITNPVTGKKFTPSVDAVSLLSSNQREIDDFYNRVGSGKTNLPNTRKEDTSRKDAFDRQVDSISRHIAMMEADAAAVGATAGAHERLRVEAQLLEAAQRSGITIAGKQADEFSRLAARAKEAADALAFKQLQGDILFERAQLGRDEIDQRIAARLRSARIDAESAAGQMLASQLRLNEELKFTQDIGKDAFKSFIADLRAGKSAADALANSLQHIADKLLDRSIDMLFSALFSGTTGGGISSILGGLIGGRRAAGGPVSAGKNYIVGEQGPELVRFGRSGTVIPNLSGLGGGQGRFVTIAPVVHVTAPPGGNPEDAQRFGEGIGRAVRAQVIEVLINERRSGGLLAGGL